MDIVLKCCLIFIIYVLFALIVWIIGAIAAMHQSSKMDEVTRKMKDQRK